MGRNIFFTIVFLIPIVVTAQGTLKLTAGSTLKLTEGVVVTLEDMHLDNDGNITLAAGDGSLRFSGNTTTNILGGSMPLFDNMEIAKTGGAQLTLQRNISAVSAINFTSGLFNLNNNNILLQPTALLNGESESSRITGTNGGVVEITRMLNAPASENPGNLGAIFTSLQNFGSTIIRRGHITHTITGRNSVNRYFDIIPANNTSLNATLRFHYANAELNGLNENSLLLWKSADNVNWTSIGFDSRNTNTNFVEKTGLADFSRWTLHGPSGTLPVTFISFNTRCENGKIIVSWKTAQEINSHRFDIERSSNGINWIVIGSLPAAGNSQVEQTYTYNDNTPLLSDAMYRIAEYDVDGRKHFSGIIRSSCNAADELRLWPNPVSDIALLTIYSNSNSPVSIQVYDSKAALVLMQNATLAQGSNQISIPLQRLAKGIYQLKVNYQQGKTKTFRLIKQ